MSNTQPKENRLESKVISVLDSEIHYVEAGQKLVQDDDHHHHHHHEHIQGESREEEHREHLGVGLQVHEEHDDRCEFGRG